MNDDLLSLKAVLLIQAADISSLLAAISRADPLAVEIFLARRKELLHETLESYEDSDPAFAAKLQETIDRYSQNYPFYYD